MWVQKRIQLNVHRRGFHLISREILVEIPEIKSVSVGMLNIFLQHSSASLTINENADPVVREDFEAYFNQSVPDGAGYFRHTIEGPDDMPAHIKSSLLGCSLNIPVADGRLLLGVWQGIYLCEHRSHPSSRHLVLTLHGEEKA